MGTNGDDCFNILWEMLQDEKWSDLKIQTATHTFNVHKSVVCPACPFFEAACTGDWKEAGSGIIKLPESERTIRSLLEWCYGVFNTDFFTLASGEADTLRYFELLVAADKYQVPGLRDEVEIWFEFAGTTSDLVEVALWVYQEERRQAIGVEYMRSLIADLACDMAKILNGDCWEKIQECPELAKDLMRFVAQESSRVNKRRKLIDPEHLREPAQATDNAENASNG